MNVGGKITLAMELGKRFEAVSFYAVESLCTQVLLGCDFCDKHVESIRPLKRVVELDDGTTVPIIRVS